MASSDAPPASSWAELPHVLACNGVPAAADAVAQAQALQTLEAFFGELPRVALLPPLFPLLTTLRLVHQVRAPKAARGGGGRGRRGRGEERKREELC